MPAHSGLTGTDLHEVKGAASASSGQLYSADGAGSAAFITINNRNLILVTHTIPDISTASSSWVTVGFAGAIEKIVSVIDTAITGADATLSFEIGGTEITAGGITITQVASAAGDVDSSTPSADNVITDTDAIELITDGGSTTASKATITFLINTA